MKKVDISVGKRLRQRRTMMGLSQEALAKGMGITFQQIQKYEKGTNAMNSHRLYTVGQFLNVPVSYFFEDEEKQNTALSGENSSASDREFLELMKAFKLINSPVIRKRVSDLVRAIAHN
jgi:transcriptional regulator with XRE-family HTH domain